MKRFRSLLKLFSLMSLTLGLYAAWAVGNLLIPNKQYWRQLIFRGWARGFVKISSVRIETIGEPPRPPFLLVCNHLGYLDIAVLRSVCEGVFVAKGEIESWFLMGRMTRDTGNIFINRQNRRDIPRAGLEVLNALERGEGVMIFPEGTSSSGATVSPFKSSFLEFAAKADLPVYYAALNYQTSPDAPPASRAVCWGDDTPMLAHVLRFLELKSTKATLIFGEKPLRAADRKELAEELWRAVNEKFIPVL